MPNSDRRNRRKAKIRKLRARGDFNKERFGKRLDEAKKLHEQTRLDPDFEKALEEIVKDGKGNKKAPAKRKGKTPPKPKK